MRILIHLFHFYTSCARPVDGKWIEGGPERKVTDSAVV